MKYLAGLLFLFSVNAQTLSVTASNAAPHPGDTVTLNYVLGNQPTPVIAALRFDATVTGMAEGVRTAGSGLGAIKTLVCTNSVMPPPPPRCVAIAANSANAATPIPSGVVATSTLAIPLTAAIGSQITVRLSNLEAVVASSNLTPLAAGSDLVITVRPFPEDLNGDGVIDGKDVGLSVMQVLAGTCAAGMDVNGDAVCNLKDTQQIINKAVF